jgi:hypothetical protein
MYKTYRNISLAVLATTGFLTPLQAQKQVTHQSQYWLRYYGKYNLSPDWDITLEIEDRRFFKDNRQANWVLPRVIVERKLRAGWSAGIGFTYYTSTNPADPSKPTAVTVPELRPHQELSYKQEVKNLTIGHRFKLEERWTRNSSGSKLTDGYSFKARFRYQLQLQYLLVKKKSAARTLTAKASDEIMLNLGHSIVQNTFDQNRAYLALNYVISDNLQVVLGYMNYFQEQKTGTQYYARDIIRLTFYHTINFYKKH